MKKTSMLLLALVAVSLLFACAPSSQRAASTGAPISGGEIRFGFNSEPATLDPLSSANTADGRSILFNVYEGLVKCDPQGIMQPAIAESYEMAMDGSSYSFVLREGILFSDGTPVTPRDIEFTLNTARDARFSGFTQIAAVEITGERSIRIDLNAPDVDFLTYLTIGIVPADNPDREGNPIGSGPFIIESYTIQQSLVLVKNPYYWKSGFPYLDKVTLLFAANSDALYLGLQGGNFDGAVVVGSTVEQLDPERFDVVYDFSNSVQMLALNNAVPPLDNLAVRQAINYGIDIDGIIDTAFYGRGKASGSPLIPGLAAYYDDSLLNPYPVDRERARQLLAEAGYPQGFPLEIVVPSNYSMHVDTAQVIVNQLAAIGIAVTIRQVDWATWLTDIYRGRNFQATVISLDSTFVSPRGFLGRYISTTGSNYINFKSEEFDRVYQAALNEPDLGKRIELYKEAQRIVSDNAASVFIQDIYNFKAFTKGKFGGWVNYPLYVTDFSSVYRIN